MTDYYCDMDPCPCYGTGYANGKDKAYFEIETWERRFHTWDYGCEPCKAVRRIAAKLGIELKPPPEPPEFPVYLDAQGNEHGEY